MADKLQILSADGEVDSPAKLALTGKDLHVYLAGKHILRGLNFEVSHGELVALLGPNGAGKTTLFRAILGLIPASSGAVKVYGPQGVLKGKTAARAIGYVPQRQEFNWGYPINVENVVMSGLTPHLGIGRRPKKQHWEQVYAALERVKMLDLRERTIGQLSGGQRQRVLIARALVSNPQVLLLDEPFTGLDQPSMDLLLELFQALAREGSALLMSTHDLTGALTSCDRVIMLNRTIRAQGSPQQLCNRELWRETYEVNEESPLLTLIDALAHQYGAHGGLPVSNRQVAERGVDKLVNSPSAGSSAVVATAALMSVHEHSEHGEAHPHHHSLDEHLACKNGEQVHAEVSPVQNDSLAGTTAPSAATQTPSEER